MTKTIQILLNFQFIIILFCFFFILQTASRSASYPAPAGTRLDLCYVAERMLALHLPERDSHAEAQAAHMLSNKHGEHFMVSFI